MTATFSVPSGTLSATSSGSVTVGGTSSALTLSGSLADARASQVARYLPLGIGADVRGWAQRAVDNPLRPAAGYLLEGHVSGAGLAADTRLILLDLPSLDWRLQDRQGPPTLVLRISRLQMCLCHEVFLSHLAGLRRHAVRRWRIFAT